jgi:flagellar hook-associated protein 2
LLDALKLSTAVGGALVRGLNAEFSVNGGAVLSSMTNTLESSVHGIAGLSVTVNTATRQTLQVESDTVRMQGAIEGFIEKFNAVQDFIGESTKITVSGTTVTTAVLANNREVQAWASHLRALAFDAVGGVTGDITRLDDLGIDFNSTSGRLQVKNSGKLATALGDKPEEVKSLFLTADTGLVSRVYSYLGDINSADRKLQANLSAANVRLDEQIARMTARLEAERESLTTAFIRMLDAQSAAQSQSTYLNNMFFKDSSN